MVRNSISWNISEEKCLKIIHLTIIDILSEKTNKTLPLNKLIEHLNSRTRIYKLTNHTKNNTFSKYLKIKYNGILNFIENYNFYGIIKTDKNIHITLYKHLINLSDIHSSSNIITQDWVIIDDDY